MSITVLKALYGMQTLIMAMLGIALSYAHDVLSKLVAAHQHAELMGNSCTPSPGGNLPFSLEVATCDMRHPPECRGFICMQQPIVRSCNARMANSSPVAGLPAGNHCA